MDLVGERTLPRRRTTAARADSALPGDRRGKLPEFPTERAERSIEMVSRLAGPVVFVAALGGIAWLLFK